MNCIIINLSYHKNRKYDMIEKIKKTNIQKYFFYNAIDGNNLNNFFFEIIPGWIDYFKNRYITIGEIGCALSHYNIWKYIVDNKLEKTLILEDDVIFYDEFNDIYNKVLNFDLQYDIFYLSRNPLNQYFESIGTEKNINDYIVEAKSSYNLSSYIITYNGAKKLINTNYLNYLLPIDDFLSIMYDKNYPFKNYSKYFINFEKLICYSLKNDITNQNTNYYGSINDNSNIYIKTINYEYLNSNIMTTTWNIDLNYNYTTEEKNNFSKEIDTFLDFSEYQQVNFFLNHHTNNKFCFIEKVIYDNIKFHTNRLNISLDDKYISFWTKKQEYTFNYIHMHIDHCDYESRIYDTENRAPLFTSIIYFNDNDCPTLVTDITRDMYNNKDFIKNKKLLFSFPRILKNIVFEGGKYIHGESYLSNYELTDRKAIVIAVWDNKNKPLYVPYFDSIFYYYHLFTICNRPIKENEYNQFDKNNQLLLFKNRDNSILTVKCNDDKLLNYDFFYKLVIDKEKKILYRLNNIINKIKNPDTVIIDFSDLIIKKNYHNVNNYIDIFNISFDINEIIYKQLISIDKEYLLDITKKDYTIIEKYIYDISLFNIKLIDKNIEDFYITFDYIKNINSYNKFENSNFPILSSITFLENCDNPIIISDIDIDNYKYKNFNNNKSLIMIPNKFTHIIFKGKYYYNNYNREKKAFIINIWKKEDNLNFKKYNNNEYNIHNKETVNYTFKELNHLPNQLYTENNIYENILYKNEDYKIHFMNMIEKKDNYYILNIKNIINNNHPNSNVLQKLRFTQNI
jgi:GR25 family glycosyltransferase involved in LPS biosynthesis